MVIEFDFELEKVIEKIKEDNARRVVIQMPDGLKPEASRIAEEIREKTDAEVLIWMDSCFGSCDLPLGLDKLKVDLLIQFGHNRFGFEKQIKDYEKN